MISPSANGFKRFPLNTGKGETGESRCSHDPQEITGNSLPSASNMGRPHPPRAGIPFGQTRKKKEESSGNFSLTLSSFNFPAITFIS